MKRDLGLLDSTMIVAGSMIGSGIFLVSPDIARTIGSPGYILLIWIITGIITLIAALSYGELAAMMPKAGGQYIYLREAYNPLIGFLFGWTVFMVIQTGVIAAVSIAFSKYSGVIFPAYIGIEHVLLRIGTFEFNTQQLLAVSLIALLTYINLQGVKHAKILQTVFTLAKILSLVALIILGIYLGMNSEAIKINLANFWDPYRTITDPSGKTIINKEILGGIALWAAVGAAMVGSLFSSDSWNNITYTAGEIKDPKRNIPLSLFFGTLIVTVLYILVNVAYMMLLPVNGLPEGSNVFERGIMFAEDDRVATAAMALIFGEASVIIMAALIMVSTFGCNNGLILSGARLFYAMAKDGVFFKKAGTLNKNSVPGFALIIQGAWAVVLCLSGSFNQLLDYATFSSLLFYVITILGLFILRRTQPDAERPYKAFGYPFIPALYIILAGAICVVLLVYKTAT